MMNQPQGPGSPVPADRAMAAMPPGIPPEVLALLLGQMADPMALAQMGGPARQQQQIDPVTAALMGMGIAPPGGQMPMGQPMGQGY